MGLRLGIDVGGTFTDFALLDPASGDLAIHKTLTTPDVLARVGMEKDF
jgi:N-methylhydantoinase A/oxoprolinase/acetone carboxylase beta subunit